jgi:hypothetical protein
MRSYVANFVSISEKFSWRRHFPWSADRPAGSQLATQLTPASDGTSGCSAYAEHPELDPAAVGGFV